ncbi:MAG TPA: hypothetical protein VM264_02485 [Acidimicrobiales bacterium]|nr:hypothetical protein [Acidimicrobiales bacterium]
MRKSRLFGAAILSGAVLAATPNLAAAAPPEETAAGAGGSGVVSSGEIPEALAGADYWTSTRLASARPATPVRPETPVPNSAEPRAAGGPSVSVAPTKAGGPAATEAAAAEEPEALHAGSVPRPYTNYPDRLNGKVFFAKYTAGGTFQGNFVCSGTVVNSENKSIVWTAGHCVHGGRGGSFHRNWIFIPAYSSSFNGHEPYGRYTRRELWTRTEWASNSNFRQDVGAAVVNRRNNIRIVDALGGQGITFNQSRSQTFRSYGYPQASPFNGFLQWVCVSGRISDDFPAGVGPATIKIHCNMTGGSSGGGWLIRMATSGLGYVNSVNSYRYGSTPDNIFGPYHGNEALSLYNTVRSRPA